MYLELSMFSPSGTARIAITTILGLSFPGLLIASIVGWHSVKASPPDDSSSTDERGLLQRVEELERNQLHLIKCSLKFVTGIKKAQQGPANDIELPLIPNVGFHDFKVQGVVDPMYVLAWVEANEHYSPVIRLENTRRFVEFKSGPNGSVVTIVTEQLAKNPFGQDWSSDVRTDVEGGKTYGFWVLVKGKLKRP